MNSRVSIAEDNRARFAAFFGLFFGLVESAPMFFLFFFFPLLPLASLEPVVGSFSYVLLLSRFLGEPLFRPGRQKIGCFPA